MRMKNVFVFLLFFCLLGLAATSVCRAQGPVDSDDPLEGDSARTITAEETVMEQEAQAEVKKEEERAIVHEEEKLRGEAKGLIPGRDDSLLPMHMDSGEEVPAVPAGE